MTTSADTGGAVEPMRYVNGVFKGGGAKGIAYAGALTAMRARGLWFHSVAGASAGAITASLIAAGMLPAELELAVPKGLAAMRSSVPKRIGKAILGQATSVFESRGLREWLDRTLAAAIGKHDASPVTFADLFEATEIELYVVAMDLSNGLPVVFCRRTTPMVEVAGAVAASSAIPGAFPPGRGVFHSDDEGAVVHQFVDGGTWANYPSFVFQDRSFRAWLRSASQARGQWADTDDEAWQREANRPVVGFILGNPEPLERRQAAGLVPLRSADVNRRFDQGPTYTSPKRPVYLVGAVLSSDWARLLVGLAMAVWVALSLATMPVGVRRFSTWLAGWLPDWLYPVALVGTLSMVVLAAVVAIGLMAVLVLVGRLVADTLLPSMQALIGVPTSVAPWIGLGDDSVVLRVPHIGLKTTDFAVTDAARLAAVKAAHQCVCAQLDDATTSARLEALFSGVPGPAEQLRLEPSTAAPAVSPNEVSLGGILAAVIATAVVGGLGWWGTNSAGIAGIEVITLAVVGGLLVGGAALVYVGGRAGTRSATRARYGVGASARRPHRAGVVAIVAGVAALVAGAALSMVTMDDRADDTREAKVLSAQAGTGSDDNDADHDDNKDDNNNDNNTYIVAVEGLAAPVTVISDRHLRLSEAVFVRLDAGAETARLVGALDDGRFGVAVVCWMLGLGLITSGVRRRRWDTRCARLGGLVAQWHPR
ncbi:MAG: patatin-like phospholipase family protein [Acidimicrobiaceae bacterium]|nr:patatin-like phospholipase family protein [Acidimicrobiaceae bacterium]